MIPSAGFAADQLVSLHDQAADLTVASTAGQPGSVGGEAALNLKLAGVSTQIKGSADASRQSTALTGNTGTRSADVQVDSSWHHGIVRLNLNAEHKLNLSLHDGPTGQALYVAHSEQQNDATKETAKVTVQPLPDLTLAAQAQNNSTVTVQSETFVGQRGTASRVDSASTTAAVSASWKPLSAVTATAQATVADGTLHLQNSSEAQLRWQATEPRLALTVTPFSGTRLTIAADRSARPVSAGNLAAWHAATGDINSGLKPDTAGVLSAALEDKLGPLTLQADYKTASLESTTVLAPGPSGQIPQSIAGGSSQAATIALSLSMAPLGLSGAQLSSQAGWHSSQIRDPVTGRARALSGEIPHQASIQLTDSLPGTPFSFGLNGQFGTQTHYYQVAEDTAITTGPSAGAFIKYNPGRFALTLSVNGLGGGTDLQNSFYQGSRAGDLAAIDHSQTSSTSVGLTFTKTLDD